MAGRLGEGWTQHIIAGDSNNGEWPLGSLGCLIVGGGVGGGPTAELGLDLGDVPGRLLSMLHAGGGVGVASTQLGLALPLPPPPGEGGVEVVARDAKSEGENPPRMVVVLKKKAGGRRTPQWTQALYSLWGLR